jgi:hypothetical protein
MMAEGAEYIDLKSIAYPCQNSKLIILKNYSNINV